jgi:hypothetical protein
MWADKTITTNVVQEIVEKNFLLFFVEDFFGQGYSSLILIVLKSFQVFGNNISGRFDVEVSL